MENTNLPDIDTKNMELQKEAIDQLTEVRKWTNFLSVAGLIFMGLIFVIYLFMTLLSIGRIHSHMPLFTILIMIVLVGIYFFPLYYLYKFSEISKGALEGLNSSLMTEALTYLKKHYKFVGILFIIMLSIYFIVFFVGISAKAFL